MKTKDLIDILTQYDPSGEKEVLIMNNDIDYVVKEPMYESERGYIISKRENYKQPTEVILKTTGQKINLVPLNTFEYYREKILQDQQFIEIKTENDVFYWESPKIAYNKIFSLCYCKEYLNYADKTLYPYKDTLIDRIESEIKSVIISYQKNFISYCEEIKCKDISKKFLLELIGNIFTINNKIILSLPLIEKNGSEILFRTIGIKNFKFEILNSVINLSYKNIYNGVEYFKYTNLNSQDISLKMILNNWNSSFQEKIEKLLF